MLLKRVLTAIFPCQYCFVDLNVSARIPFLSPWFWLRCTIQSQCSTIAVPSSVLLRAVGLSPSPIRLPIDAEKRRAVSGKGVVEMIGPVLTCLQIVLHILHFDETKIADKTDYRTEKLKSTYCTHMEAHPLFLQILGTAPLPPSDFGTS